MRILLTTDAVGGVLTYTRELLRALVPAGFEMGVAVLGPIPAGAPLPPKYEHHPGKLEWMENPWDDVAHAEHWLEQLIARYQPDAVHLNSYLAPRTDVPIVLAAHSCVLSWWQAVKQEPAPETWRRYRTQVEKALRNADRIVTPTHAMREALLHHYGAFSNIEVIANTRSPQSFCPNPKRPVIFTAGRLWDEAKNLNTLAAVAPHLAWPVFAAGDTQTAAVPRTENLRLLGRLEESQLAAWLGSSAIYTLPALYEPFGLSVLEAALAGCALVLGDIPSLRELWDGAAVFVDPRNPHALRQALQQLIRDDDERAELQLAARRRARLYSPIPHADAYTRLYQTLVGQRRLPCAS